MEKRDIPIKHYYYLGLIVLGAILLTFYLINRYKQELEIITEKNSPLFTVLYQINDKELENYFLETSDIAIYLYNKNNIEEKFENNFYNLIVNHNLKDELLIIDVTNYKEKDFKKLNQMFSDNLKNKNIELKNYNNIVIIENKKIVDILYEQEKIIVLEEVNDFFLKYEVIND